MEYDSVKLNGSCLYAKFQRSLLSNIGVGWDGGVGGANFKAK